MSVCLCVRERRIVRQREGIETDSDTEKYRESEKEKEVDSPADMSHRHHKMDSVDILKK